MDLDKIAQIWTLLTGLTWQGNALDNNVAEVLKNAWDTAMSVLNNTKVPNLSEEFHTLEIASSWDLWSLDNSTNQKTGIESTEIEEEGVIEYIWEMMKENKHIIFTLLCGWILMYISDRNKRRKRERQELREKIKNYESQITESITKYFELFKDEFENYKKNSEDSKRFDMEEIEFEHSEELNKLKEQIIDSLTECIGISTNLLRLNGMPVNESDKDEIITLFKRIMTVSEVFLKESIEKEKSDDSIRGCIKNIRKLIQSEISDRQKNFLLKNNIWCFIKKLFYKEEWITHLIFCKSTLKAIRINQLSEPNLEEDLEKSLREAFLEINNMARQIATSDSNKEEKIYNLIIDTYKLQGILEKALEENGVRLMALEISKKQELINKMEEILINIVTAWYIDSGKVLTNVDTEKQTKALEKKIADLRKYIDLEEHINKIYNGGQYLEFKISAELMWDITTYDLALEALINLKTTIENSESDF